MTTGKSAKSDSVTYGNHEVITPDTTKLRRMLRAAIPGEADPIEAAEEALKSISSDFSDWMADECNRLDTARARVRQQGLYKDTRQELFLAAHDLKGDAMTLGFPEVSPAADSLCRLLEHSPDLNKIPLTIIDQHVDAVRAIVREHERADIAAIAAALTGKLRAVTDEFLIRENKDRPEVLKAIQAPSMVPEGF